MRLGLGVLCDMPEELEVWRSVLSGGGSGGGENKVVESEGLLGENG